LLVSQLLLGALPHTDRLPDQQIYLTSEAGATALQHVGICEACVLSHVPATPAMAAEKALPLMAVALALPATPKTVRNTTPVITRTRAPPALALQLEL